MIRQSNPNWLEQELFLYPWIVLLSFSFIISLFGEEPIKHRLELFLHGTVILKSLRQLNLWKVSTLHHHEINHQIRTIMLCLSFLFVIQIMDVIKANKLISAIVVIIITKCYFVIPRIEHNTLHDWKAFILSTSTMKCYIILVINAGLFFFRTASPTSDIASMCINLVYIGLKLIPQMVIWDFFLRGYQLIQCIQYNIYCALA